MVAEAMVVRATTCPRCGNPATTRDDWETSCLLCGWAQLYRVPDAWADVEVPRSALITLAPPEPLRRTRRAQHRGPRHRPAHSVAYLTPLPSFIGKEASP